MTLIEEIDDELKDAMRARDAERRDTLRLILSSLQGAEKELQRPLSEQEELVSIRPKSSQPRVVVLSRQQVLYYFFTIVAVAPIAITVVGVAIWWRRKKL